MKDSVRPMKISERHVKDVRKTCEKDQENTVKIIEMII